MSGCPDRGQELQECQMKLFTPESIVNTTKKIQTVSIPQTENAEYRLVKSA